MTIRCLSKTIPEDIRMRLGWVDTVNPHYQLTVGKHYVVYGLCALIQGISTKLLWNVFYIVDDQGRLTYAPACMFDLEDTKTSMHWKIRVSADRLSVGCDLLLDDDISNRLVEGDKDLQSQFLIIKAKIDAEALTQEKTP